MTTTAVVDRIPYLACPLCDSPEHGPLKQAACQGHPLWHAALPATMEWRLCHGCGHQFTSGWFDDEGTRALAAGANAHQDAGRMSGRELESHRRVCARVVDRVAALAGGVGGRWLDVGVGNGALLAAADEFGFSAEGVDLRAEPVARLVALGYRARCERFEDLAVDEDDGFDVVSMADVLEHLPFPREAVAKVRQLLRPGGLLFVSMPNSGSLTWRALDAEGCNPYWGEVEHYHNFDRARLMGLLSSAGLEPIDYGVSDRYLAGMEVVARRR